MKGKSRQMVTAKASRGGWKPGAGQSVEWFPEKHRKITKVRVAGAVRPTLSGQGIENRQDSRPSGKHRFSVPVMSETVLLSNIGGNTESTHFVLSGTECVFYFPEKPLVGKSTGAAGRRLIWVATR